MQRLPCGQRTPLIAKLPVLRLSEHSLSSVPVFSDRITKITPEMEFIVTHICLALHKSLNTSVLLNELP